MASDAETGELPAVGEIIDGRYRLEALHALGGMGSVFRATHLLLARTVALKIVPLNLVRMPGVAARFLREARAATQLENPHIVKVFDVGVLENGCPYLVMEWLEGRDLEQVMEQSGSLSVEAAVDYVLQACEALAEVHGRGIVHRDLKPSNLFVVEEDTGMPRIRLLDFGISKIAGASGPRITQTGTVLGSPSYMSPEQMGEADTADERTDVWGLGIVLYELVTGTVPFGSGTLADILSAILLQPMPLASEASPNVPPALDEVLARALRPEPADRFPDVASFAAALVPFGPDNAAMRARTIADIARSARLRPLSRHVAARDEDLISAVDSNNAIRIAKTEPDVVVSLESDGVPRQSMQEAVDAPDVDDAKNAQSSAEARNSIEVDVAMDEPVLSLVPRIPESASARNAFTLEKPERTTLTSIGNTRGGRTSRRAVWVAVAVFVVAIGAPAGLSRFAPSLWQRARAAVMPGEKSAPLEVTTIDKDTVPNAVLDSASAHAAPNTHAGALVPTSSAAGLPLNASEPSAPVVAAPVAAPTQRRGSRATEQRQPHAPAVIARAAAPADSPSPAPKLTIDDAARPVPGPTDNASSAPPPPSPKPTEAPPPAAEDLFDGRK